MKINIVVGRMKFDGEMNKWIVGAYSEYSKALDAKNTDYKRLVHDEEDEREMKDLPDYEIIRVDLNTSGYWEI